MWQDILKAAIIGTERSALVLPARNDALGNLLATLDANARETSLLSAAATVALYERAGQLPTVDSQLLPVPAESEDIPCCSARAAQHLSLLLSGEGKDVLPDWLAALATAQQRVPEESLPALLAAGKSNASLRELIGKVIGKRGVWLAQQNLEWDYVGAGLDESLWQTGARSGRLALLQPLRATDPTRARELVSSTWSEEKPEDRAAFIAAFITGLSLADEPFLEAALDDRRKEVRRAAADLLSRLPASALVQRMLVRVTSLITYKRKLLGKGELVVVLPEQCDKAMQRDGIEPKPPHPSIGEKAWWLQQIIAGVPPSFWNNLCGANAADVILRTPKEWHNDLLLGWSQAAIRCGDAEWIEALLDHANVHNTTLDQAQLMEALTPSRQEVYLTKLLAKSPDLSGGSLLYRLFMNITHLLSEEFSRTAYQVIVKHMIVSHKQQDYGLRYYLQQLVTHLHPAVLTECLATLATLRNQAEQLEQHNIEASLKLLEFRIEMRKEIKQ